MASPVLRCHHRSGSLNLDRTVNVARVTRAMARNAGNENTLAAMRSNHERGVPGRFLLDWAMASGDIDAGFDFRRRHAHQTMQICAGYLEITCRQGLVAVALLDSLG